MSTGHSHRPSLKQSNKAFKSKHSSKGSLKTASKGRVPTGGNGEGKRRSGKSIDAAQEKANRRNHAKQIHAQKRAAVVAQNKLTKGAEAKAPRVVAIVQLCEDLNSEQLVTQLLGSAGVLDQLDTSFGIPQVDLSNPRARLQFLTPTHGDLVANLDAVATADFIIFAVSGAEEVGAWGESCIRSLASFGMGEGSVRAIVGSLPENPAAATQVRKSLLSFLKHFFPSLERVFSPLVPSEASNLMRSLADKMPKGVLWRETRARLLAEEVGWIASQNEEPPVASTSSAIIEETGTLTVTGVIRGSNFSANRLVHIQGFGDYQVEKIVSASSDVKQKKRDFNAMDDAPAVGDILSEPTEEADDMVSTNVPSDGDDLLNEQTWPTEEEIAGAPANVHRTFGTNLDALPAANNFTTPKRLIRVPKGTSAYQAKWLAALESDEEDEEDYDDEDEDGMEKDENAPIEDENEPRPAWEQEEEEYEYIDPDATDSQARGASTAGGLHQDLPMDIENAQYESYMSTKRSDRSKRDLESKNDLEFPDEVDTPLDIPARERFARYRGLKSFRTSHWDPYENLPRDYARCFMFQNYKMMARKLAERAAEEGVEPGTRVTIYIKNVPKAALERHSAKHPLVVFGLLQHEHKFSIINFTTTRNTEYTGDIRSKDQLIVQLGCRRFVINPLWSQHTQGNAGKGSNNVHKFERYLRPGPNSHVGTAYMPITFGSNVPALIFKDTFKGDVNGQASSSSLRYQLVGSGSLLGVDPTRIIAKRIILTGHPYKVHKKTATIRYMFFNQPDVDYFKPIELRTKKGRTGHIRESLGTHGYLKAGFDGQIDAMDTICLNLYKRCFPKWARYWTVTGQEHDTEKDNVNGDAEDVAMA